MGIIRRNIFTIILAAVLIGFGYIWYSSFLSREETNASIPAAAASREFLSVLALLERIKIDPEFFQSPNFLELKSGITLPPLPAERGRANPFR